MKQLLIYATLLTLLASCGGDKTLVEEKTGHIAADSNMVTLTDAQAKNAGIETGTITRQAISSVLKVSGKIDVPPQNITSISVPMGGYLKSTKLLPGMHIRKGEVLGVVEDAQYIQIQQDFLSGKTQLVYLESEFNRQRELNRTKATSDKVFEQARAAFQGQQVLVKALEQKLRLIGINPETISAGSISRSINIYSPINGFVSAVNVNIGKYVNPSDVLFELVNPDDIHLALTVFEKDINKLYIGQKVYAHTNTDVAKKYPCSIILISKSLSKDRSTEVHCHFEQYDKSLLPGMYMNADIEVTSSLADAVPDDAVVRFENRQYVFVTKGAGRYEMREVQTGASENGFTAIRDAASFSGQQIVTKGAYSLLMAMKNTSDE